MPDDLPEKVQAQITKAGLPTGGQYPFHPKLVLNRRGEWEILKQAVATGPKVYKRGYVDDAGRIWVRDHSHAGIAEHWDVQLHGGADYFRVDNDGNPIN